MMPGMLSNKLYEEDDEEAVKKAIGETEESRISDMGKVMGALKGAYTGQMDFGKAGGTVKALLG